MSVGRTSSLLTCGEVGVRSVYLLYIHSDLRVPPLFAPRVTPGRSEVGVRSEFPTRSLLIYEVLRDRKDAVGEHVSVVPATILDDTIRLEDELLRSETEAQNLADVFS